MIERCPVALTIAGSDSGGNAGIQADLRAFHVFGVHGCTAIAALTAQNPDGVTGVLTCDGHFLKAQLDAVFAAYSVGAVKTGMLASADLVSAAAETLRLRKPPQIVVDPVMVATSGSRLLADDAVAVLVDRLLPCATLLTPNLPEAGVLLGEAPRTAEEMVRAARTLADRFGCAVLLKGGHATAVTARDVLVTAEGLFELTSPRVADPVSTHGTGCSLSAAIAASLATGRGLLDAVVDGKAYVYEAIRTGVRVGPQAGVLGTPRRLPVEQIQVTRL